MKIQDKLNIWVKLTNVNPAKEQKSYTINMSGGLSDFDIKQMNDKIKEALKYDATGVFADAYLSEYFEKFIADKSFSVKEMLANPETESFLADARLLQNALAESDSANMIKSDAEKAMNFYGMSAKELSLSDIIEVRTSAERCMNGKLSILQFSSGTPSENGFKMSKDIYMYRDLDAMLYCAADNVLDGVSLGYIRNEGNLTDSYFAFIIKNGRNLYLLTDKPKYGHPLMSSYRHSRCPGRDMSRRIEDNMFPYDSVANIDTSDLWGSGRYGTKKTDNKNALEITESPRIKIGTFKNMEKCEAFWAVLMISMIKDKFYKEVPQYELSYTGSMIQTNKIEASEYALTIRNTLPAMKLHDIASIDDTADCGCENEYTVLNYIVDRYKDRVDKDLLNVIADTDEYALIDKKYTYNDGFLSSDVIHPVKAFDLSAACGTKEEIEADQKWMARYNYAAQIQKLAEDDYEQHRQSVSLAVGDKIIPRIREICKSFVKGELSDRARKQTFSIWYNGNTGADYKFGYNNYSNKSDMKCTFSGKTPSVALVIEPKNVDELAFVCGCKKEELPEQIQHWKEEVRYCGNELLNRLDPMSFKISDPFQKMTFKIVILLSKKEYLSICDEAGVKRDKFWELEKPSCFRYSRFENNDTCCGRNTYDPEAKYLISLKKCRKCKFFKQQQ